MEREQIITYLLQSCDVKNKVITELQQKNKELEEKIKTLEDTLKDKNV